MKTDPPLRVIFDTATGCAVLVVLLVAALLLGYVVAQAQQIVVKTGVYQLDTGDFVHWWIDEPHALLCTMIADTGLSCLPLNATPYAWPALPQD